MTKILLSLLISLVIGCDAIHDGPAIIVNKYPASMTYGNDSCICHFYYIGLGMAGMQDFYDSCNKYNIGDTIKSQSK